jgi:FK506-binding protein
LEQRQPEKAFYDTLATFANKQKEKYMSLIIEDLHEGTGKEAQKGKRITVHYTGRLEDGTKFDSSLDRRQPFTLILGAGQVIEGWDKGFDGMKEGGKRKLTIPPEMGYGVHGAGGVIPPNATLVFEVELLHVQD